MANWKNLPDSYFVGKFVMFPFPIYDPKDRMFINELVWVKVTGTWGNWLVGEVDADVRLRPDTKRGDVIHFAKEDIDRVMGVTG